ncbi:MAG TPA: hypothetical protein VIW94_08240 [Acidimicrobiia bacterium]
MRSSARLGDVELPDFGMPVQVPQLPSSIYADRMRRFRERAFENGYDVLVVYADREHSANLSYLTGFDPRFEEALLIIGANQVPSLLVGNECVGIARAAPLEMDVILFQEFSLPGQPRDRSQPLSMILDDQGFHDGTRVGLIGWKTFPDPHLLDLPSYITDSIREACGRENVENATGILIDSGNGLRVINELEQLASFEYASCQTSNGVRNLLFGLEPGTTEQEAVRLLEWNGAPLSCHLMLTAGDRARYGLLSPSDRAIEIGDPMTVAFGIWGALNCRAGFVVDDSSRLPGEINDYVDKLVAPYFETVAEWYRAVHIGQAGGVLHEIVDRRLGDPFFGIFLNPGHQLHLDEWVNSPVGPGSVVELQSAMALQVDIIPATGTPYFTTNIEDGIALADDALRSTFALRYPDAWSRIQRRRDFMRDSLGIELHPEVLPLSNIPAFLTPFLLSPHKAMTLV